MFDAFIDWVDIGLFQHNVTVFRGVWVDAGYQDNFVAGTSTLTSADNSSEVTIRRYRVVIAGPFNNEGESQAVEKMLEGLRQYALDGNKPCGASHIFAFSEPRLGSVTTTGRATGSIDFEVIF